MLIIFLYQTIKLLGLIQTITYSFCTLNELLFKIFFNFNKYIWCDCFSCLSMCRLLWFVIGCIFSYVSCALCDWPHGYCGSTLVMKNSTMMMMTTTTTMTMITTKQQQNSYTIYYYYSLSPLCSVFTIIYLIQTMFVWYTVLQLFCSYNLWHT
jgi:hypothetical protein